MSDWTLLDEPRATARKVKKEDIGHPTDFRHITHIGGDFLLVEERDIVTPLAELATETTASNTQTETDGGGIYEEITQPVLSTKPPPVKRKAPKPPPPDNANPTKPNHRPAKIFGGWRGFMKRAAPPPPPSPTLQQETPATTARKTPLPLPGNPDNPEEQSSDVTGATIRSFFRRAPPPPPAGPEEDKTSESVGNMQMMAAMMTLKLINRYPDDYVDVETVREVLPTVMSGEANNTTVLVGESIYDDIGPVEAAVARDGRDDVLLRGGTIGLGEAAAEAAMALDGRDDVLLRGGTIGLGETAAEAAVTLDGRDDVLLRGGTSQASTRRRNSALNALDTVIMSFGIEEEEDVPGIRDDEGRGKSVETEEESIYEDIDVSRNVKEDTKSGDVRLASPEPPQVLPRTISKEDILETWKPPKLPPKPAPRRILVAPDKTEQTDKRLTDYLEEFYEFVPPKEASEVPPVEKQGTRDADDEEVTRSVHVLDEDGVDISASSLNDLPVATLQIDLVNVSRLDATPSNNTTDSPPATVEESVTAMSSQRKQSLMTWNADKCPTLGSLGDRELKLLLMKAGVTDHDLQDKPTRDFILQFINEHGGKDRVKMEAMFLTTLAARPNRRRHKKKLTEVVNIAIDDDESTYM